MTSRWRPATVGVVCLLVVVGTAGITAGADNEPPLADAGLDRDVTVNATVHLDATGSRDPDGTVTGYEWSVEAPDGNTTTPDCQTCGQTEFVVRQTGQYNVTVTVTDDDGAKRSDTLYVTVSEADGPEVTVTGPTDVTADTEEEYTATVNAGDEELSRVDWDVDDEQVERENVDGESVTETESLSFASGTHTLTVTVYDELGRTDTATLTVTAESPPDSGGSGGTGSGVEYICQYADEGPNHNDCEFDSVIDAADGTVTIYDTNGDGVITVNGTTYEEFDSVTPTITVDVDEWNDHSTRSRMEIEGLGQIYLSREGRSEGDLIGTAVEDSVTDNKGENPTGAISGNAGNVGSIRGGYEEYTSGSIVDSSSESGGRNDNQSDSGSSTSEQSSHSSGPDVSDIHQM